jgi:hypothetical protein
MEVDQNLLADAKKAASQLARYGAYLTRLKNNLKAHKKASSKAMKKKMTKMNSLKSMKI